MTDEEYKARVEAAKQKAEADPLLIIHCVFCHEKIFFVAGTYAVTKGHVYSEAGAKEVHISRICEYCFDETTKEDPEPECTCDTPCCEVDVGVGVVTCGSQHCRVHGRKES